MAPLKMLWNAEGDSLASEWVDSKNKDFYNPTWMQSPYPCEAAAQRSSLNQAYSLSQFGTRYVDTCPTN